MIQDIAPHIFTNEYKNQLPVRESYALYYEEGKALLIIKEGEYDIPRFADLEEGNEHIYETAQYLFRVNEQAFYLVNHIDWEHKDGFKVEQVQTFRHMKPQELAFAGITGYQLYNWYESHRYCGRCQSPMIHDSKERMLRCESCGQMEYPKISPAVIVGITNGNRLLMSQYAGGSYKKYALIAGFTEIGEAIEETVKREVMEEVGLQVKNLRYYKSQPWSFSDTLLLGFFVDLDGDDTITLDEEELAMAEWFEREDIPVGDRNISLTNEMILAFKNREL